MFFRVQVFQGPGFSGSSLFMVQVQVLQVAGLRKIYSENMQQITRRTPMPKCDFNKAVLQLY